jgi:hypothetical protein
MRADGIRAKAADIEHDDTMSFLERRLREVNTARTRANYDDRIHRVTNRGAAR